MISNAFYMSRLRGNNFSMQTIYGHAMSFDPLFLTTHGTDASCIRALAYLDGVTKGSSVPIFRGGPPIFTE